MDSPLIIHSRLLYSLILRERFFTYSVMKYLPTILFHSVIHEKFIQQTAIHENFKNLGYTVVWSYLTGLVGQCLMTGHYLCYHRNWDDHSYTCAGS